MTDKSRDMKIAEAVKKAAYEAVLWHDEMISPKCCAVERLDLRAIIEEVDKVEK